jgi:hypothetical protein
MPVVLGVYYFDWLFSGDREMTPAEQQVEQLATDIVHAQHGDWPSTLAEALRMVQLATAQSEATEMLVALRVMELVKAAQERSDA